MAKKSTKKSTESQIKASLKYQRKFAHVSINMDRDLREEVARYCEENGTSLQKLVNDYLGQLVSWDPGEKNSAK